MNSFSIIGAFLIILIPFFGCSNQNPTSPNVPYIDSTLSWVQTNGITSRSVFSMAYITGKLYAGTDSGIFLSTNNGTSWTHISSGLLNYYVISLLAFTSDSGVTYLFAGTQTNGVYLSTDNGISWTQMNTGLGNSFIASIMISPNQEFLYAATWGGVFRSTDKGLSWSAANVGLTYPYVQCLAIYDSNLFAGTMFGIFHSADNGSTWSPLNFGHRGYDDILSLTYITMTTEKTYLFAGTQSIGVHFSADNGTTWSPVDTSLRAFYIPALTARNSIIFSAGNGVFASSNFGARWVPLNRGLTLTDIRSLTTNETYLFAGALAGGVWRRKL